MLQPGSLFTTVKDSVSQDYAKGSMMSDLVLLSRMSDYLTKFIQRGSCLRMYLDCCRATEGKTSKHSSVPLLNAGIIAHGKCLTACTMEYRRGGAASSLSDILETGNVQQKYFLSPKACRGILRRAKARGKDIPKALKKALETVASAEPCAPQEQD